MLRKNLGYTFLLAALLLSVCFFPTALQAACSPYHGLATINEIHDQGKVEYFVEVKPLDSTIPASIYNNWTVTICNDSGTCVGPLALSLANQTNYPWLVLGKESVSDPDDPIGDPDLIDVSQGMDVILLDGNGDTIDYVNLNGYTAQQDASCTPAYDWQVNITQSNTNTVQRIPDGTGTWTGSPGGSNPPTDTTTNDPLPDGSSPPALSVSHVIVSSGQTANFILTLEQDAAYDITVDYQTLDDTALAGTHYTATSGTISIPAGTTAGYTVTIPVNTLLPPPATDVGFYLFLDNPVNVALPSQFAIGTISSSVLISDTRFDECSWPGTLDVLDSSGNNLHGTAVNGPISLDISEESGGACMAPALDGVDDYFELPPAFPNLQGSFTISAWIRADNLGGDQRIFADDQNNSGGFAFSLNDGGNGRLRLFSRNVNPIILDTGVVIQQGQWHFVAAVHDAATKTRRIYVDANMVASDTYTGSWGVDNGVATIGGEADGSSESTAQWRFEGAIDEVLVFGSVVSDSMINIIYNNQLAKKNYDGSSRTCNVCGPPADTFVMSTDGNAELVSPSLTFDNNDAVEYSGSTSTATILHDIGSLFSSGANLVNALHLHPDGHVYFSLSENSTSTASYGSQNFDADDILDYDPLNDTLTLYFDGDSHFSATDENIDALYIDDADDLYISTTGDATIGGQAMEDEDIVQYTPATSTASLYFVGDDHFRNDEDVDGFHIIDADNVLLSTTANARLGGILTFTDGDVIKYNTSTNVPTLFFDETYEFVDDEEIDALTIRPPLTPVVDHYEISHINSGVTCETVDITITGHDSSHNPVAPGALTTLSINTSTGRGSWLQVVTGTGTLSDPTSGDGAASYEFPAGESLVTLRFAYTNPISDPDVISINVNDTTYSEQSGVAIAADDPPLTMATAGFIFYNATDSNKIIPVQLGGKASDAGYNAKDIELHAVRASDDNLRCTPLFPAGTSVTVQLGAECINPATCQGQQLSVNSTAISTSNDNSLPGAGAYTGVSLLFSGVDSVADLSLNYPDVGIINLHARYDLGTPALSYIVGTSNNFVVRPFGFDVSATGNPAATTAAGAVYTPAGTPFTANVRAVLWEAADDGDDDGVPDNHTDGDPATGADLTDNTAAPNFGQETSAENVILSASLFLPAGVNPGLSGTTTVTGFGSGAATSNVRYDEVGIIEITANLTDSSYLGAGNVTGSSGHVGRFTPAFFYMTISPDPPTFSDSCAVGSYTYLGQNFNFASNPVVTLTAFNAASPATVTQNYDCGNFFKLTMPLDYTYTDGSASGLALSPSGVNSVSPGAGDTTNCSGTVQFTLTDTFNYARPTIATPIAPFAADIDLTIAQGDLTDSDSTCFNPGTGCASFSRTAMAGTTLRHGRLKIFNNYGPETRDITSSPFEIQYWDDFDADTNFEWGLNTDENAVTCTTEASLGFCTDNAAHSVSLDAGSLGTGAGTLTVGHDPANNPNTVRVCPIAPAELTSLAGCGTNDKCGIFTFGIYRGNDRIINWREIVR